MLDMEVEVSTARMQNSPIHDDTIESGRISSTNNDMYSEYKKEKHNTPSSCPLSDQSSLLKALPDIKADKAFCCSSPKKTGSMRQLMESLPSERSLVDPNSGWTNLDSVHSSKLDWAESSKNDSMSMSTSSSSFASFGESGDDVVADSIASQAFTKLAEVPTPRAVMLKQHSLRLRRGASYRGSLSLIEETILD